MATVTIGKSYLEALLHRAEFHATGAQQIETESNLASTVLISSAEYDFLHKALREYNVLKDALFKGGLAAETLETLLVGERLEDEVILPRTHPDSWDTFPSPEQTNTRIMAPSWANISPPYSDHNMTQDSIAPRHRPDPEFGGHGNTVEDIHTTGLEDHQQESLGFASVHGQRTIFVTNLAERTTHKDLVGVVRGGKLLDVTLRGNRTATISFVEGAPQFLAYAKRTDVYLQSKRLEFRWSDRQFRVSPYVANKVANGASRNLVVRGGAGKLTEEQLRDHLDHIHNLVVVDIFFKDGDAFISTNSIHNALFARTCMMSRTAYKGLKVEWWTDECAAPLPRLLPRIQTSAISTVSTTTKRTATANIYALLGEDSDSDPLSDEGGSSSSCQTN